MAGILYDARRIKAYEGLLAVGEIAGQPKEWCDMLWGEIIVAPELLEELIYYLEHHCLTENVKMLRLQYDRFICMADEPL